MMMDSVLFLKASAICFCCSMFSLCLTSCFSDSLLSRYINHPIITPATPKFDNGVHHGSDITSESRNIRIFMLQRLNPYLHYVSHESNQPDWPKIRASFGDCLRRIFQRAIAMEVSVRMRRNQNQWFLESAPRPR